MGDGPIWASSYRFSPEVQLQSIATLQQNPDPVFRLRLEDANSQEPFQAEEPIYIQGNVLRFYGRGGGGTRYSWSKSDPNAPPITELTSLPVGPGNVTLIRQHFTLDMPIRSPGILFGIYPLYRTSSTSRTLKLIDKGNLIQGTGPSGYEYSLLTSAFEEGRQNVLRQVDLREDPAYHDLTSLETTRFPGLIAKCEAILKTTPGTTSGRVAMAQALSSHLQVSGEYAYSLDRSNIRIPGGVDPIEDFVTTSKKGYCQYFASALALMLRHRDIPCRLVNGYCTSEYNDLGGYYQVRQHHAHVWVEAFLAKSDLAQLGPAYPQKYPRGAWMRLDPTPEAALPAYQASSATVATDSMNLAQILWRDYVVGMNPQRQQKTIYDPFKSTMLDGAKGLFSADAWKDWFAKLRQMDGIREMLSGDWFNWRGGLAATTVCAGLYALYHLGGWFLAWARDYRRARRSKKENARARSNVEFYDRFEANLKQLGLVRPAGVTPREFVRSVPPALADSHEQTWKDHSAKLIDLYYQVRFGGLILNSAHLAQVEKLLESLAQFSKSTSNGTEYAAPK